MAGFAVQIPHAPACGPHETRDRLFGALEACAHNPVIEEFKTGVLQV